MGSTRSKVGVGVIATAILCAAAVAVVAFVNRQKPKPTPAIDSWSAWEDGIDQKVKAIKNAGDLRDFGVMSTAAFRDVLATDNRSLWLDMANQPQYPLVVLSGYLCIEKKCPELSFRTALYAVLHLPNGSSINLYFPTIVARIQHAEPSAANFATYSEVAASISGKQESHNFIVWGIAAAPLDFLYKWFHDAASDNASASFKALVLDHLYAHSNAQYPLSARMRESLDALGELPGRPRLIWLVHTSIQDKLFEKRFAQVLEDDSLDSLDVTTILVEYSDFVRNHHDALAALKLSDSRRKLLEEAIKRPEK